MNQHLLALRRAALPWLAALALIAVPAWASVAAQDPSEEAAAAEAADPDEEETGAEAMPTDPQAPSDFEQQIAISDAMLDQFAQAWARVQQVEAQFDERLEQAQSDEELGQIAIEASLEIARAMQSTGLALEDYNLIRVHVHSDPALLQDLEQRAEAVAD